MAIPPYTEIIKNLPTMVPFVGPETIERNQGKAFLARIGANESVFGISPHARTAMAEAACESWMYCDPEGYDLRLALASANGIDIESVVLGAGIDDLLGVIVRTFMNPGDAVVASYGSYPTFAYHVHGFGGVLKTVPYRNDANDLQALTDAASEHCAKILFLANPDNPTGSYYPREDIEELIDRLPDECLFIFDEAYLDFVPRESVVPMVCDDPRIVRVRTFSKAHGMAGARVGYAISHPEIIQTFNRIRLHFGVNRMAQEGALASLGDEEFIASVIQQVNEGRLEYESLGRELGLPTLPSRTNFVSFDLGTKERAVGVMTSLIEQGVFVRMPGVPPLDRLVRISIGTERDRALFAKALRNAVSNSPH